MAKRRRGALRFGWLRWIGLALLMLVISFGVGWLLSTFVLFPKPETAGTGVEVPRLYEMERSEAEGVLSAAGLNVGDVTELTSGETEAGRVLAQDPVPGQQLRRGASVSFAVSSGPPSLRVPAVVGLRESVARDLLESAGFDVEVEQVRTSEVGAGIVTRTEPESGAAARMPARVRLVVGTGAPADTMAAPSDSLVGTEGGAAADTGSGAGVPGPAPAGGAAATSRRDSPVEVPAGPEPGPWR